MQTVDTLSGLAPAVIALLFSGVVAVLMGIVKAVIEIPLPPTNKLHDSTVQGTAFLMGIGLEFWFYKALSLPMQGGILPVINGILVGSASMGNYAVVAKRLGFTGLTNTNADIGKVVASAIPSLSPITNNGSDGSASSPTVASAAQTPATADVVAAATSTPPAAASPAPKPTRRPAPPPSSVNTPAPSVPQPPDNTSSGTPTTPGA